MLNVALLGMTNQPVCSVIYSQYNPASHTPSLLPACPQESSMARKSWCSWRVPHLWDPVALVLAGVTVLLSSSCGNEMPETAWRTQQMFITHSPGGWRSKGPADSVSVESLFPCVWVCVSMSPLSSDAANMINKNPIGFLEILSLLVVPWVQGTESSPSWPGSILFLYILFSHVKFLGKLW